MFASLFSQWILPALLSILCTAGSAVLGIFGAKLAKSPTLLGKWAARGMMVAQSIVHNLEATTVPELKLLAADGSLSSADIAKLRNDAWTEFTKALGTDGLAALQKELGVTVAGLQGTVMGWIEQYVAKLASNTPSPATSSATATVIAKVDPATAPTPVLGTPQVMLKAPATPR